MPPCIAITNSDIVDDESPMPPREGASARYDGTQLFKPHHPKSVHAFINVTKTVTFAIAGVKSSEMRPRSAFDDSSQICGASTLRRIQSVNTAGSTPTKNTTRNPQSGIKSRLTNAARPYPIAHELWTNASALPRCLAGNDSDTSAAPVAHSPPMPRPRKTRNSPS